MSRCSATTDEMRLWFNCVAAEVTRRKLADPPPHVGGYGQDLRGRSVIFLEVLHADEWRHDL